MYCYVVEFHAHCYKITTPSDGVLLYCSLQTMELIITLLMSLTICGPLPGCVHCGSLWHTDRCLINHIRLNRLTKISLAYVAINLDI